MMMPGERCFVDTNVLVYSTVAGNPWYDAARLGYCMSHSRRVCRGAPDEGVPLQINGAARHWM